MIVLFLMKKLVFILSLLCTTAIHAQLNTDRITAIGRNALYFDDYVLSIQYFNQVIKLKPYLPEPYLLRAIAKIQLSDFHGAIKDCNTALEFNPFQPGIYYVRGFAYRNLEKYDLAEQDFDKALQLSPENRTYLSLRADVRASQKKFDEALLDIDYLIKREPTLATLYYERGVICMQKEDTAQAKKAFTTTTELDSQNPSNWSALGMINLMENDLQEALENLTKAIVENAWKEFLSIQEKGGVYQMIVTNQLQDAVAANLKERLSNVAKRKEVLLGSNQFPNFTEKVAKKIKLNGKDACCACSCENAELKTLPVARAAEEFEQLRLATENAKKQPVAFMLTIGNLAMRIARAQFSCNFLACAGYKVVDNNGFKTVKDGIKAAKKAKADVVVLCSSDDEYATFAPEAFELLKKEEGFNPIYIVAGAPACMEDLQKAGIQNFIHVRSNVLETLKSFNQQLLDK